MGGGRSILFSKLIITSVVVTIIFIFYYNAYSDVNIRNSLNAVYEKKNFTFSNTKLPSADFLVWSENCQMRNINPFTPEVLKVYKRKKPIDCSNGKKPLISKTYDSVTDKYRLRINANILEQYINVSAVDAISCCYKEIVRSGSGNNADRKYTLLSCVNFDQDYLVPEHIDGLIVECRSTFDNTLVYQDALFFVQNKEGIKSSTLLNGAPNNNTNSIKFGVLLIGIDSLSRFNFRRTMPLTLAHLEKNNWFELAGYNKIGDNTLPNLMALLAGLSMMQVNMLCKPTVTGGLDDCPIIWKLYKENGFATAYAEDESWMSTFNYLTKGFLHPPTDYYLRPFMLAIEKNLPIRKSSGLTFCIGYKRNAEYIYDYGLEFAKGFLHERIFGLFWTNSFSHNSYSDPSAMDERMLQYMRELQNSGVLNASVVIFFSDHGSRWGTIRDMPQGFLDERLPMFFISLPDWFKQAHPKFVHALKVNRNRLTSPYDIFMTLQHLLAISTGGNQTIASAVSCPKCQSVLLPVAENRTCKEAGIENHWCTCIPYETVSKKSKQIVDMTKVILDRMFGYLKAKELLPLCSKLRLKGIIDAYKRIHLPNDPHSAQNGTIYRIIFEVSPKKAQFESTLTYFNSTHIELDVENISRLNAYAADATCVDHKIAKKFCICKDYIKN